MAAETIPTIDLSAAARRQRRRKARGGAPDRRGLHGHRLLHGDRPRRSGRPHRDDAPARNRLLRPARRREDEGAAAAGKDQPRLQLGRRSLDRLFDGTGDAARYPGGVRIRPRPRRPGFAGRQRKRADVRAEHLARAPAGLQAGHGDLLRRDDGARFARAARHGDGARRRTRTISPTSSTARPACAA